MPPGVLLCFDDILGRLPSLQVLSFVVDVMTAMRARCVELGRRAYLMDQLPDRARLHAGRALATVGLLVRRKRLG